MNSQQKDKVTLVKALGTKEVMSIAFGLVVCVSTWGAALIGFGSYGFSFLLSIAVSGIIYILIAMQYSELATMYPRAASIRTYVESEFGNGAGMAASMIYLLSFACGFSAETVFFSHVMNAFVPAIPWYIWALGVAIVFGLILNLIGITEVGFVSNLLLYLVVGIAILVAFLGLTGISVTEPDFSRLSGMFNSGVKGFFSAFLLAMWLFAGFEVVCPLAEECKKPERDLPRGMFGAIIILGTIKILFVLGAFVVISDPSILEGNESFMAIGKAIGGNVGMAIMFVFAFGATSATCIANYSSNSRLLYGMSQKPGNMVPEKWGWLHPKFRTPWITIFIWFFITNSLVLGFGKDMTILLYIGSFVWMCQYLIVLISGIGLRMKIPNAHRPYRVPGPFKGFPVLSVIGLVSLAVFLTFSVLPPWGDPKILYWGGSMIIIVIVYSIIWRSLKKKENVITSTSQVNDLAD